MPASNVQRRLEPPGDRYDVIVVGSGIGGLVAGALLARHGRSVLLVEQHDVAGGAATIFRRRGYEFDVGLHYVGGCHDDGVIPRILRASGVPDVVFEELDPDGYDILAFPDATHRVPRGIDRYRERLVEEFPDERRAIDRWVRVLHQLDRCLRAWPRPLGLVGAMLRSPLLLRHQGHTLERFFDDCRASPRLRAVLGAQHVGYALPPSRASLLVGAGIALHYLDGAYYPRGGGQVLADRLADAIEAQGGRVLLGTTVDRIRVADGEVAGVELTNKRLGTRSVEAPVVVCNADLKRTVTELVGESALGRSRLAERQRSWSMAPPLAVLYLGLARDLVAEGHPRANYWVHADDDIEAQYRAADDGRFHPEPCAFVTLASVKDPGNPNLAPPGHTNVQVMTVAPAQPSAWGLETQADYRRQPAYLQSKQRLTESLLGTLERALPGAGASVALSEVATPMTHTRYTGATGGTSYGLAAVPAQFGARRPGPTTTIGGLYLCGASCRTGHGILGAAASGLAAASAVLPGHLDRTVLPR